MEITAIVMAVIATRMIDKCACAPSALYASSGPYADDERPSAPRPTQARNVTSETRWKTCGSVTSRGGPMTSRRRRALGVSSCIGDDDDIEGTRCAHDAIDHAAAEPPQQTVAFGSAQDQDVDVLTRGQRDQRLRDIIALAQEYRAAGPHRKLGLIERLLRRSGRHRVVADDERDPARVQRARELRCAIDEKICDVAVRRKGDADGIGHTTTIGRTGKRSPEGFRKKFERSERFGDEAVADPRLRDNVTWIGRVGLDLAPQ